MPLPPNANSISGPEQPAAAARIRGPRKAPPPWVLGVLAGGASGALMAACYWPLNWHWAAWVALVPWLLVLPRLGPAATWLCGTILALVFYRLSLAWLFDLYGAIAAGVIIGLALLMGFAFGIARLLMDRLGRSALLWAVPFCFVGQEVLRSEGHPLYRFSQVAWGYSQAHNLAIAQIASLGGVYFLTFCIVAVNAAFAHGLALRTWRAMAPAVIVPVAVLVLALISRPPSYDALPQVAVACVQEEGRPYDRYRELTAQAAAGPAQPTFIVLPEHTITETTMLDEKLPLVDSLEEIAARHDAYICVGAHTQPAKVLFNLRDPAQLEAYIKQCFFDNSALLVGPEGRIVLKQSKMVPVPFYADGNPGREQKTCATPYGRVGLYVCYDETFTDVMRRLDDAGLLLGPVLNNKKWPPQQRWQQADMAPFRCIELRRCIVRAASSGISQIIEATGRVQAQRTQDEGGGILYGAAYFATDRTPFVRGGYLFTPAAGIAFLAAVAILTLLSWFSLARRVVRRLRRGRARPEA